MALTMHAMTIAVIQKMLINLVRMLEKGEAYAATKDFDPTILLNMRLAPDMYSLTEQVQTATHFAKTLPSRLTGREPPPWEDGEKTFAELKERIRRAQEFVDQFKPKDIDGSETRAITANIGDHKMDFTGQSYALNFAMPNFYFHVTASYTILRHAGVSLGKADFIGELLNITEN
jgi:hypothetical protein